MSQVFKRKLVKGNKNHVRLKLNKEQLLQLGFKTLGDEDDNESYLVVYKKDNRHKNNGLFIVNHVFRTEN